MCPVRTTRGFTLVELMISLVLGLLISAAVMQVYLINARTAAVQKSGSELQDASVFGLQQLESRLRLANLGNPATLIDSTTAGGGVVLSLANMRLPDTETDKNVYVTHSAWDAEFESVSNITAANSDQLTIQFTNTTGNKLSDCESADIKVSETVIERYFLRTSTTAAQGLVLACDAGRLNSTNIVDYFSNNSKKFGTNGQAFILGIDQFKVLLGTQSSAAGSGSEMRYLTPNQYMTLATQTPPVHLPITAIKIGVIARGNTPIVGTNPPTSFSLFGQRYTLKADLPKLVRNTYETTVLLRNARVITVDISQDLKEN